MATHESLLIDHALQVLREIARDRTQGSRQCPALKLALRVLLEHAKHRCYIDQFWRFAEGPDPNHRCRNLRATIGAVAASVGRAVQGLDPSKRAREEGPHLNIAFTEVYSWRLLGESNDRRKARHFD